MAELTLQGLAEIIEAQNKKIESLTEANTALQGKVGTLSAENEPVKLPAIPADLVEVNKKQYLFQVASFKLPGNDAVILAEEAVLDKTIIAQILKIDGQGILKEQA